jgi:hypothetical protein
MYEHTDNRCFFWNLLKVKITRKNNAVVKRNCELVVPINFESFKCVRKQILEKHATLINTVFSDYKIRTWWPWERFIYIFFDGAKDCIFQT